MPTPLSCKSASALDSLPRNANSRRSGTALHRLQQQRLGSNSNQNGSYDNFGFCLEDGSSSGIGSSSTGIPSSPKNALPSSPPRRKISNKFAPRKRKTSQKSFQAIASNDLPLASSDLYSNKDHLESSGTKLAFGSPTYPSRDAFSDGEEEGLGGISEDDDDYDGAERHSIRVVGVQDGQQSSRVRSSSLSPRKLHQPRMMPMIEPVEMKEEEEVEGRQILQKQEEKSQPSQNTPSTPIQRRQQITPARKRIITKDMIGKPTNFQHTGHIGASSYGGAISMGGGDADKLRQQLSEVAAALKLDDSNFSSNTSVAPSREPSKDSSVASSADTAMTEELPPMPMAIKLKDDLQSQINFAPIEQKVSKEAIESSTKKQFVDRVNIVQNASTNETSNEMTNIKPNGIKRTTSKRKPVPAPRNLADLYSEFSRIEEPVIPVEEVETHQPTSLPNKIIEEDSEEDFQKEPLSNVKPIPTTIRANGKRMVEGPAGEYITETANVRWNKALNEIALALKDDGNVEGEGNEDESIQKELQRADEVLRKLEAI